MLKQVKSLVDAGVAVMGHIGLTPQSYAALGGWRVQGRTAADASSLLHEARQLEEAGCFAIVLEMVPAEVAEAITRCSKGRFGGEATIILSPSQEKRRESRMRFCGQWTLDVHLTLCVRGLTFSLSLARTHTRTYAYKYITIWIYTILCFEIAPSPNYT